MTASAAFNSASVMNDLSHV